MFAFFSLKELGDLTRNNDKLWKFLGISITVGAISYYLFKKINSKKYKYPVEIIFSKNDSALGTSKEKFLSNLEKNHEKYLLVLQRIYPNECTLNLGRTSFFDLHDTKIIFLNSIDSIKRFLEAKSSNGKNDCELIASRPSNLIFDLISKHFLGSFFRMYDEKILEVRKKSLVGIHKLLDNNDAELGHLDEINQFIEFLDVKIINEELNKKLSQRYKIQIGNQSGLIENFITYVQQLSVNLTLAWGLGLRFPYDLNSNTPIKLQINHITELLSSVNLLEMENFKAINKYFKNDMLKFVNTRLTGLYSFLSKALTDYKSNYDAEILKTFVDHVIQMQNEKVNSRKEPLKDEETYSDKDILVQLFTLIMAAAVTTGFTLSWAFYYLSKNKQIQETLHKEIVEKLGNSATIDSSRLEHLPYARACVNEVLRLSSTQALIPRATQSFAKIDAYKLPANTTVVLNAYAVNRDAKYWHDYENFDPSRWLDENNNLKSEENIESFIPFGISARSCIGKKTAKTMLFLVITNLIQRYEFDYVQAHSQTSSHSDKTNGILGIMRKPHDFNLKITQRS